jgi:hypothetical protein
MNNWQLEVPVAFIVFNRPDTTERVFHVIRQVRPRKLLIVSDGPREDKPEDYEKCRVVRTTVDKIDWVCEVLRDYSDVNLGCKNRVSSGLDWVFSQVEEAIILEDDCLPDPTFFRFCQELLEKYRCDTRIMSIGGTNLQPRNNRTADSYYFSFFTEIWGWATWKRAWKYYDVNMERWPIVRDGNWLEDILHDRKAVRYWKEILNRTHKGLINTWDYQWLFSCWIQGGLHIIPHANLVSNIGFGKESTHKSNSQLANLSRNWVTFPLQHPPFVIRDVFADKYYQEEWFVSNFMARLRKRIRQLSGAR